MEQFGQGIINDPQEGWALAIGCGLPAKLIAKKLQAAGCNTTSRWILSTRQEDGDGVASGELFSAFVALPNGEANERSTIAKYTSRFACLDTVVLFVGNDVHEDEKWDRAFLCANLPSNSRHVVSDGVIYSLSEYVNIFCKPSEQEWIDSNGESIACTLYGNIGQSQSGLHSLFLGKSAYERFIDSYYLDDLLKTKYYNNPPEKYYYMLYFALVYFQQRTGKANLTELGATLWATMDKIDQCHHRLKSDVQLEKIEWISIELSDYLRRLSHLLHASRVLTYFDRWQHFHREDANVGFSHLVTPYAFHDEPSALEWVGGFGFCLWVNDFTLDETRHLSVNGKKWTLMSLRSTISALQKAGREIFFIDAQDLDAEGQIKRASLIIIDKEKFAFEEYMKLIALAGADSVIGRPDFRPFDFDPASLWQKIIKDEEYYETCANSFSAGFAGALAITPTQPYELRWDSENIRDRVGAHLRSIQDAI